VQQLRPTPLPSLPRPTCRSGSVRTSNTVTISGINGATPVSVSGGEYSIGCTATFTSAFGQHQSEPDDLRAPERFLRATTR
jgi:hypothetical protein